MLKQTPHIHQALVNEAKQNKKKAQSQLYTLYFKAMYNTSLRIVGESYVAEDLMQDAFIDAFKNIHQFDEQATFGAWLKRIVINKSINHVKKQQLIAKKLEDYSSHIEDDDAGEEENMNYSIEDIKSAMKQLSPQYKIVFSLYMIEGYDHDEIAEIMQISSSTSRSQLSRGKQQLKKLILSAKSEIA